MVALYKRKSDLAAFNTLFGSYKNAKNTIYNVLTDLGEIVARDNFYTNLLKKTIFYLKMVSELYSIQVTMQL